MSRVLSLAALIWQGIKVFQHEDQDERSNKLAIANTILLSIPREVTQNPVPLQDCTVRDQAVAGGCLHWA